MRMNPDIRKALNILFDFYADIDEDMNLGITTRFGNIPDAEWDRVADTWGFVADALGRVQDRREQE